MESLLNVANIAELHITRCLWFATLTQIAFEKVMAHPEKKKVDKIK